MATRRRIGVSIASTEAARRQLMQPVPCWEKLWVPSEVNANLKVYKWVKTEKVQHFSDDEGEGDEPLAPLPDEPEIIDGDEEMDQDETAAPSRAEPAPKEAIEVETNDETPSKVPSPKPQLSMSLPESSEMVGELDASLKPLESLDANMDGGDDEDKKDDDNIQLDVSGLGPDGLQLESSHDLTQLDAGDALAGGTVMDGTSDPFTPQS